ncbi:DUF1996 domain-containing protein [Streptomyces sp. NPDC005017]|uniref:DUF1996 domain-containing protein n=1 Tax=Streptomyces sp. NPDC005017 TaxID=3364706 RepID=UPI00369E5A22
MLGGGGLVAVNVYASATGGDAGETTSAWGAATIDCPDVGERLTSVPDAAREGVDKELATLDQQIADAYRQLQEQSGGSAQGSPEDLILKPLTDQRSETIGRIAGVLEGAGEQPEDLGSLAPCTLVEAEGAQNGGAADGSGEQAGNDGQAGDAGQGDGGQGGIGGQAGNGPVAADYADITTVQPNVADPQQSDGASRGTFASSCGVNAQGLFNSDNVIVAPGVTNGAHHFHDYIGNQDNDAFASDDDLAAAGTSCVDQGDKSSYYWPVLRLQNGTQEQDAQSPGGGIEGNAGEIVTPKDVTLNFVGSPVSEVTAMPRLLRIITGDAKSFVNGPGNANASWSCTGFEDRQLKDKYPLCPSGSDVVRTFKFQSCWDGRNIDSANHRTHVAFADGSGNCPSGFQAIPQLVQRIVYDVDAPSLNDGGQTTPLFAVDSFPEQLHKPQTDHGDFINVFDEGLMGEMVACINEGRQCGAGAGGGNGGGDGGDNGGGDQPTAAPEDPDGGGNGGAEPPAEPGDGTEEPPGGGAGDGGDPTEAPAEEPSEAPRDEPTEAPAEEQPQAPGDGQPEAPGNEQPQAPGNEQPDAPGGDQAEAPSVEPKSAGTPSAAAAPATTSPEPGAQPGYDDQGSADGQQVSAPQGDRGPLADTGANLWPAAAGSALLIGGGVLLLRTRRASMRR